ncbi:MAG: DUF4912 domain-containing protein [Planctomycetaceae bacterium]|nr:DUF4912 domain-containing protein [Planctomycetaceae bacterium]
MYTAATLRTQTVKDLGKLAEKIGVEGWRAMRKDELVRALVRAAKRKAAKRANGRAASNRKTTAKKKAPARSSVTAKASTPKAKKKLLARKPTDPRIVRKIQRANESREQRKNLATGKKRNSKAPVVERDQVVLLVRDAYWLQAIWELSRQNIERAQAAMAAQWHTARPVLRLVQADAGATTNAAERLVREIDIHGGVKTWYIDVQDSPKNYRVDIGYVSGNGKYCSLARSNSVTTPRPGATEPAAGDWEDIADNCEKIYALSGGYSEETGGELQELFEERLGRRMGSPVGTQFGVGADKSLGRQSNFDFDVDAELIVYGATKPNSHVTLAGTPVKLRPDGSFSARLSMPDRRQVLPVVASSPDGAEQRTVVLAVERNTKVMEPKVKESTG